MFRSGSTVQYQLAAEIVERNKLGIRLGFTRPDAFPALYERYNQQPGFKVVKMHLPSREANDIIRSGRGKAIYAYRDMRDVVASWSHKTRTPIDELLKAGF